MSKVRGLKGVHSLSKGIMLDRSSCLEMSKASSKSYYHIVYCWSPGSISAKFP